MLIHLIFFPLFLLAVVALGTLFSSILFKAIQQNHKLIDDLGLKGMLGLFFLGMMGVIFNFFLPLASAVFLSTIVACIVAGCVISFNERSHVSIVDSSWFMTISLILAPLAGSMRPGSDGGLYHLPHQLWLRNEPIVIGIANFHGRFGFSSLYEYIGASLWINEQLPLLSYLQASFLVFFLLFLIKQARLASGTHLVLLLGVTVNVALFYGYMNFLYAYTDLSAGLCFAVAFVYGHWLLYRDQVTLRGEWMLFSILLLSAIFYKVSAILLIIWFVFVLFYRIWLCNDSIRECLFGLAIPFGLLLIWLLRGVLTTGCLLYPEAASCLDVPWSAYSNAVNDANWVTAWARHPESGLSPLQDNSWFLTWWLPYYKSFLTKLVAAGLFVCLLCGCISLHGKFLSKKILDIRFTAAAGFILISFLFWFMKSPTPRFGIGVFILLFPVLSLCFHGKAFEMSESLSILLKTVIVIGLVIFSCRVGSPWKTISLGNLLTINTLTVPRPEVTEDAVYGVRPNSGEWCWLVPECSPYDRPYKHSKSSWHGHTEFYSSE